MKITLSPDGLRVKLEAENKQEMSALTALQWIAEEYDILDSSGRDGRGTKWIVVLDRKRVEPFELPIGGE